MSIFPILSQSRARDLHCKYLCSYSFVRLVRASLLAALFNVSISLYKSPIVQPAQFYTLIAHMISMNYWLL